MNTKRFRCRQGLRTESHQLSRIAQQRLVREGTRRVALQTIVLPALAELLVSTATALASLLPPALDTFAAQTHKAPAQNQRLSFDCSTRPLDRFLHHPADNHNSRLQLPA
jgi:hypothetical protein